MPPSTDTLPASAIRPRCKQIALGERGRISERVRDVKDHLRSVGRFVGGRTPTGYRVSQDKKLVRDEEWAAVLSAMKRWKNSGHTYVQISRKVQEKFGRDIAPSTCFRTLQKSRS